MEAEQTTETQESTAETTVETTEVATEAEPSSFYSSLSEEWQSNETIQNFKEATPDTIAKTLANQQSMIGKKGIIPPNREDEADVTRYNEEMGIPSSADLYKLDAIPDWAKEVGYNQDVVKNIANKAGLTDAQAKIIEQGYLEDAQNTNAQYAASQKEATGKAEQENRSLWGEKYDEKVNVSNMVADKFSGGDEELAGRLKDQMDGDPKFRKVMAEIGGNFAEHRIGDFEQTKYDMTSDAAQLEIDEMRADLDGAYMSDKDPEAHIKALARMAILYKMAQPRR